jgi:hypothetical protein
MAGIRAKPLPEAEEVSASDAQYFAFEPVGA